MKFVSGLPETACGAGSTMEATKEVRRLLPEILFAYQIRTFLDAPCGDGNWMSQVVFPELTDTGARAAYLGIDSNPEHLARAAERSPERIFLLADLTRMELPQVDLIFSRDFLQHLHDEEIRRFIAAVLRSKSRHLLVSHHPLAGENCDLKGSFRKVDLIRPPWHFADYELKRWPDGVAHLSLFRLP